jgi:hypothetical protein
VEEVVLCLAYLPLGADDHPGSLDRSWSTIKSLPPTKETDPRAILPGPESALVWRGGASFAPVARQAIFPETPLGRYMRWSHDAGREISPGQTLGGFGIESKMRPGLTTAWFAVGKLVEFDQSWPREIFKALELFEDRQWRERYLVTVGPMFGPLLKAFVPDSKEWWRGGGSKAILLLRAKLSRS